MAKNILTLAQAFAVQKVLQSALICVEHHDGDPFLFEYSDETLTSDEAVAAIMGFPCTKANVLRVREELFGALRTKSKPRDLEARVRDLEAKVAILEIRLNDLTGREEHTILFSTNEKDPA